MIQRPIWEPNYFCILHFSDFVLWSEYIMNMIRVCEIYVQHIFCNSVVFGKIMLWINYEGVDILRIMLKIYYKFGKIIQNENVKPPLELILKLKPLKGIFQNALWKNPFTQLRSQTKKTWKIDNQNTKSGSQKAPQRLIGDFFSTSIYWISTDSVYRTINLRNYDKKV